MKAAHSDSTFSFSFSILHAWVDWVIYPLDQHKQRDYVSLSHVGPDWVRANPCVYVHLRYIAVIPSVYHGWYQASKHQKSNMFITSLFLCMCGGIAHNRYFVFPNSVNSHMPFLEKWFLRRTQESLMQVRHYQLETPPELQQVEGRFRVGVSTKVVEECCRESRGDRCTIRQRMDRRVVPTHRRTSSRALLAYDRPERAGQPRSQSGKVVSPRTP